MGQVTVTSMPSTRCRYGLAAVAMLYEEPDATIRRRARGRSVNCSTKPATRSAAPSAIFRHRSGVRSM